MKKYGGITPYGEGRVALARTSDSKSINSIIPTAVEAAVPLWYATTLSTSSRRPSVGQPSLSTSASWARDGVSRSTIMSRPYFSKSDANHCFSLMLLTSPPKTCACGSIRYGFLRTVNIFATRFGIFSTMWPDTTTPL